MAECDVLVVGGGFYGCMLACHLEERGGRVVLAEKHDDLLQRASYANQARVHQGYHYPRSLLTGFRSRANYARFLAEFGDCVDRTFEKFYAVARHFSKVTAAQFKLFCERIGAPVGPAPQAVCRLFDPNTIEAVFRCEEAAFDAVQLKQRMWQRLRAREVGVLLATEVERLQPLPRGGLLAHLRAGAQLSTLRARQVFNCTYSQLNRLLVASGVPPVPLKHELTEMALVSVPPPLQRLGVTVMCGPFFSLMPFPPRGLHTLSHVRYTPHAGWLEKEPGGPSPHEIFDRALKRSQFDSMRRDAARYLPLAGSVRQQGSLWEIKTVLPVNETDDGRPILFQTDVGLPGLHCVLGAKIDNIFDIIDLIDRQTTQVKVA